ncbi:MAG: 8-oxoguanine DNA glycosylase [Chloroflexota bacterium]
MAKLAGQSLKTAMAREQIGPRTEAMGGGSIPVMLSEPIRESVRPSLELQALQVVHMQEDGQILEMELPGPSEAVIPGVAWGRADVLFTPAYWSLQARFHPAASNRNSPRLMATLREELTACVLGTYGIPAQVSLQFARRLCESGLIWEPKPRVEAIFAELSRPLLHGGTWRRYRFANQKSRYLAAILSSFPLQEPFDGDDVGFRNWLRSFPGIGFKVASWVTRNWRNSDVVAVLDVHVHRAGALCGLFGLDQTVQRNYIEMEQRYLSFAAAIRVRPAVLDAVIWEQMRRFRHRAS